MTNDDCIKMAEGLLSEPVNPLLIPMAELVSEYQNEVDHFIIGCSVNGSITDPDDLDEANRMRAVADRARKHIQLVRNRETCQDHTRLADHRPTPLPSHQACGNSLVSTRGAVEPPQPSFATTAPRPSSDDQKNSDQETLKETILSLNHMRLARRQRQNVEAHRAQGTGITRSPDPDRPSVFIPAIEKD